MIKPHLSTSISFHGASAISASTSAGPSRCWLSLLLSDGSHTQEITVFGEPWDQPRFSLIAQAINQASSNPLATPSTQGPIE